MLFQSLTPSVSEFRVNNQRSGKFLKSHWNYIWVQRKTVWSLPTTLYMFIISLEYIILIHLNFLLKIVRFVISSERRNFSALSVVSVYTRRKKLFHFCRWAADQFTDLEDFARVRNVIIWSKGADLFKTTIICQLLSLRITVIASLFFIMISRILLFMSVKVVEWRESCYRRRRSCRPPTDVHGENCRQKKNKHKNQINVMRTREKLLTFWPIGISQKSKNLRTCCTRQCILLSLALWLVDRYWIFMFNWVSSGRPTWLPRKVKIRKELLYFGGFEDFSVEE